MNFMPRRSSRPVTLVTRTRAAALAVALCAAGAVTAPAAAQFGGRAAFGEAFKPDILQRDINLMNSTLQLEEWQRPIVEALMQDYAASFNTGVEALKDKMKAASVEATKGNAASGDQILARVMEPMNAWSDEKRRMFDKFMGDLKNQLGPQQQERWPSFERALRRERMLPEGDLSGESIDLWAVMGRMQLSAAEEESTRAAVTEYEIALDAALSTRARRMKELEPELTDAMRAMNFDAGAAAQDKVMALRIAVRSANDAGVESIAAALGGERGAQFRRMALEAGYPDVFRVHPVMVMMQQARALSSLTPEQATAIDALMAEFAVACDAEDAKLYEAVRSEEPKAPRKRASQAAERRSGSAPGTPQAGNAADPVVRARVAREEMGKPFRERLLAILTPEQRMEMPGAVKIDPETEEKSRRLKAAELADEEEGAKRDRRKEVRDARGGGGKPVDPKLDPGAKE